MSGEGPYLQLMLALLIEIPPVSFALCLVDLNLLFFMFVPASLSPIFSLGIESLSELDSDRSACCTYLRSQAETEVEEADHSHIEAAGMDLRIHPQHEPRGRE